MRLNSSQITKIEKLAGNGRSLNEIASLLNIKKTTAYYHFRKIRMRTMVKPKIKFDSDEELGEVVGIFAGDGSFYFEKKNYHYQLRIHFGIKNVDYLKYVKNLLEKSFGKKFNVKKDGNKKLVLQTYSRDIIEFFFRFLDFESSIKSKTIFLKRKFLTNKIFLKGFLKGLLDTDGTISTTKYGIKIAFYTSSNKLARQISRSLNDFKIKHGITSSRESQYNVYILKGDNNKIVKLLKPFKGR